MKTTLFILALLGALAMAGAGCEVLSSRVSARFAETAPKVRRFPAGAEAVFQGAQRVLKQHMGYVVTKAAQAQGVVEGRSRLFPADSMGGARQYLMEIRLTGEAAGPTTIAILLRKDTEGDFRAGATQEAVREGGLYEMFFTELERVLGVRPLP